MLQHDANCTFGSAPCWVDENQKHRVANASIVRLFESNAGSKSFSEVGVRRCSTVFFDWSVVRYSDCSDDSHFIQSSPTEKNYLYREVVN